jgi:hypothetical protein
VVVNNLIASVSLQQAIKHAMVMEFVFYQIFASALHILMDMVQIVILVIKVLC